VSAEAWWWSQKAQQLKFTQLEVARKQAESWRAGLSGVAALLGAVLIVKGRTDFTGLARPYPTLIVILLGSALVAFVLAALAAVRAASGHPDDHIVLNGEELRAWTEVEVEDVVRAIRVARLLTGVGLVTVLSGAMIAWFAPAKPVETPLVRVDGLFPAVCGRLLGEGDGMVRIGDARRYQIVPLTGPVTITRVAACPGDR
jgi:hypothetical protein